MKTKIVGHKKVIVEWVEGEEQKIKKLHKRLDAAGMSDAYGAFEGVKKQVKWFKRTYECVLGPDHDWIEEVMEDLAKIGLRPSVSCCGRREFEAVYDFPVDLKVLDPQTSTTPRGALIKAYKSWLKSGRFINGIGLKELVAV